jgi:hypothetical protein
MHIPPEIYDRVLKLATQMTNATETNDLRAYWLHHNELRAFCESKAATGIEHPFLWESLADFTDDDQVAIELYAKGLRQAAGVDAAPYRASIRFAVAQRHKKIGNVQLAWQFALEANEEAKLLDDLDLRTGISEFLLAFGSPGTDSGLFWT